MAAVLARASPGGRKARLPAQGTRSAGAASLMGLCGGDLGGGFHAAGLGPTASLSASRS
jgi:hypothetical protein